MIDLLPLPILRAACVLFCGGIPVSAQLPTFSEGDRLGYFATYKDRNVEFGITAQEGSALTLETTRENLLQPGFVITWKPDPAKDPEAKACLALSVR